MRLNEIMSTPVVTAAPGESAERAWSTMQLERVHHLVVLDRGAVVGVVSTHDLADALQRVGTVGDHMTRGVLTATSHTPVRDAANLMRGHIIGCLPIVDDGKLAGIVTLSDLLELLGRGAIKPSPRSERPTMPKRGSREKKHRRARASPPRA